MTNIHHTQLFVKAELWMQCWAWKNSTRPPNEGLRTSLCMWRQHALWTWKLFFLHAVYILTFLPSFIPWYIATCDLWTLLFKLLRPARVMTQQENGLHRCPHLQKDPAFSKRVLGRRRGQNTLLRPVTPKRSCSIFHAPESEQLLFVVLAANLTQKFTQTRGRGLLGCV